MSEPILTIFQRHGHEPDPRGEDRDMQGRLKCQRCEASAGTDAANRICPRAEWLHVNVHRSEMQALVNNIGNTTGGKKMRKKVNQIYGRQLKDLERAAQVEIDQAVAARRARIASITRNKPRWMPTWLWNKTLDMVLER